MFLKYRYTFSLYPVVICLSPLFSVVLALCLSVSLPGVAHVKLTRPDKDNSLTQSVVCFFPLFFALFHSIPRSSLSPLSSILQFSCITWSFHFDGFHPSVLPLPFSSFGGKCILPSYLFIVSSGLSFMPSIQHQSIHLAFWVSFYRYQTVSRSICLSIHLCVSVAVPSPSQPFQPCLHPTPSVPISN